MRDAGFDNQIRAGTPYDFLQGGKILWKLNNRSAQPCEVVGVFVWSDGINPIYRRLLNNPVSTQPLDIILNETIQELESRGEGVTESFNAC